MPATGLYKLLPTRPAGACAPGAAFVTLIANETYVPGAICLRRSLERVRSVCPLVLVVADPLPQEAMAELTAAFGNENVRSLSQLRARVDAHRPAPPSAGRRMLQEAPLKSTRQLIRAGGWAKRTHQKLLLFALDGYRRAAFLDIDMLVARNIDALLDQPPFAAVAALPYATKSFNSGVFVYEPSLDVAAALHDLSQRATFESTRESGPNAHRRIRIKGAGEHIHLSDQSVLNHYFRGRWHQLPYGYNTGVKTRSVNRKMYSKIEVAVVHFVHRPKPWEDTLADPASPMSRLVRKMGIEPLVGAWRFHCARGPRGNGTALSAQDAALYQ